MENNIHGVLLNRYVFTREAIAKIRDCHPRGSGNPAFSRISGPPLSRGWHLLL